MWLEESSALDGGERHEKPGVKHIFTYFTRYLKAHFQTQLKSALQRSIHTPYNEDNCLFHDNIPLMTPSSRRIHLLTSNMAAPPPTFSLAALFGAQPPDPHLSLYEAASWSYLIDASSPTPASVRAQSPLVIKKSKTMHTTAPCLGSIRPRQPSPPRSGSGRRSSWAKSFVYLLPDKEDTSIDINHPSV